MYDQKCHVGVQQDKVKEVGVTQHTGETHTALFSTRHRKSKRSKLLVYEQNNQLEYITSCLSDRKV